MPTDPSMGFEYPDVNGDGDAWGQLLNDALETIGAHSHVPGQGEPVKSAGLRIDQDVQWNYNGSFFALLQARALGLRPQPAASVVGDLNVFYVDQANSNLYFRNNGGIPVRLTNGNQIDITLVGGIVGDYAAVGAEVAFEDANDTYTFKQQGSPRPWARMRCGDLDLYQAAASIINRVRLRSPNALAASYEVVFPGALPAVTKLMQISATGDISASNAISNDFSLTGFLNVPNLPAGNTNDYAPTGISTATVLRAVAAAPAAVITGIAGGTSGRILTLLNVGGVDDITLNNESVSSVAANRFALTSATITVPPNGAATLCYDATSSRWRAIALVL